MRYDIVLKLVEFIEQSSDPITEDYLRKMTSLSLGHVRRLFETAIGIPMNKYRIRRRLSIMIEKAITNNESLMKIDTSPYSEYKSFSRAFKNEFGVSPSEYIKDRNINLQKKVDSNNIYSRVPLQHNRAKNNFSMNNYVAFKVPDDWDNYNYISELYEERNLKNEMHYFYSFTACTVEEAQNLFFSQFFEEAYDKTMLAYDLVDAIRYIELEDHLIIDQYGIEDGERIIATYEECWEILSGDRNGLHTAREKPISEELLYEKYNLKNMALESVKNLILENKRISIIVKPLITIE